ncbi:TPA: hypothetical protein QCR36_005799 [Bacillus cereus]|uniref:Membrane protein n=3 Tax=Bacillus cereus TaxID=1396 RepID=A0AAN0SYD5_BACCE|nr:MULTISPECIES: hypothetical protein [Bacillus]EDX67408.1 hypothetical protein BC059799_2589 [Bacillus cereus NVH0597-99]EEL45454.1 hypothetical protein bcere0021_24400 [Bacillus cereus Rock3-42]ACO30202.1 hypothetical protein BCA_2713 [Bacillus cereus 03BB102]AJG55800.1 putative membrane protein [Bacillus cereus 03BB102]AJG59437.1 putative membrane protein [Bacillus cereus D17]
MADIIRLLIIILIAVFLFSSIIMEFKKPQKSMFWFSIEVLFLLGIILLIKEFFIEFFA